MLLYDHVQIDYVFSYAFQYQGVGGRVSLCQFVEKPLWHWGFAMESGEFDEETFQQFLGRAETNGVS